VVLDFSYINFKIISVEKQNNLSTSVFSLEKVAYSNLISVDGESTTMCFVELSWPLAKVVNFLTARTRMDDFSVLFKSDLYFVFNLMLF